MIKIYCKFYKLSLESDFKTLEKYFKSIPFKFRNIQYFLNILGFTSMKNVQYEISCKYFKKAYKLN